MDENKDFLNEGTVSETDTNEDNGVVDIAEMAKPNVQAPQKKPLVMKPVLVAAGIVLVVALAVIVIRLFFNSSVEGTWHYVREVPMMAADATSDEPETVSVDYYFKFERDNKVSATIGTITSRGTYDVYKNSEGQSVINMNLTDLITSYNFLAYGEYEISVSGNAFTGRKLVMSTAQDESGTIEMESASYAAPEIERENEFTVNEDIVGKWEFKQEGYDLSYEFGKDGTTKYNEYVKQTNPYTGMETTIDYTINGIYDVTDNTITVHFIYTKDSSMDIVYTLDDNTLTINGFPFVREGTATADSAE
ncbi:MAG: hypothetical protein ABS876_01635 [Ruminococcus sp.]